MKHRNVWFAGCICFITAAITFLLLCGINDRLSRKIQPSPLDLSKPVVALTFDDGPNSQYTPQVLDILFEHQAPATFFIVGEHFPGNKLLIQEMAYSGHEIGNHSFSHPDFTILNFQEAQQQIVDTEAALKKILPDYKMQFFRPPYGRYDAQLKNMPCVPIMLWTLDSEDWNGRSAAQICDTILHNIKNRDIIIFHDDNQQTVLALQQLLPQLQEKGFQFVTISQLCSLLQD